MRTVLRNPGFTENPDCPNEFAEHVGKVIDRNWADSIFPLNANWTLTIRQDPYNPAKWGASLDTSRASITYDDWNNRYKKLYDNLANTIDEIAEYESKIGTFDSPITIKGSHYKDQDTGYSFAFTICNPDDIRRVINYQKARRMALLDTDRNNHFSISVKLDSSCNPNSLLDLLFKQPDAFGSQESSRNLKQLLASLGLNQDTSQFIDTKEDQQSIAKNSALAIAIKRYVSSQKPEHGMTVAG